MGDRATMTEAPEGLVIDDELRSVAAGRARRVDQKTISANSVATLDMKLAAEEADGWRLGKRNLRSIRLERDKPADRQLEDDVWTLFHRMGFTALNRDRTFSITTKDGARRQIDVLARDDETVFVVECTHSRDGGSKSIKQLLDKIGAIREDLVGWVHTSFGRSPKLKIKIAIATRNVDLRPADRERAALAGVPIITEADLDYYQRLTGILRSAARYQFLGRYLRGEKVEGLRTRVPATRGRVGDTTFYSFLMSPHDLLRISYISHMGKTSNDDLDTYQRMVKPARLKAIGAYLDGGGTFPTNIVVNIKLDTLNFDLGENFGQTSTGMLNLPGQYGSAWVIDGQHRLYGFAYAGRSPDEDDSVVSVLAYENLPVRKEVEMFVDINTKQVKVQRNLVNEIISSLNIEDEDPRKRLAAIAARTVLRLDEDKRSPVRGRILTVGEQKDNVRCLTLTSLADGLEGNNLLGTVHGTFGRKGGATLQPGPLGGPSDKPSAMMDKATATLAGYFSLFADGAPEHWSFGDAKGGYLCTNLGSRALLVLLRKLIVFIERDGTRASSLDAEEIVELVAPLAQHVVAFFRNGSAADVASFRNRGSSLASVDQNALQMMAIIHSADSGFNPPEVKRYLDSQDAEGTKRAHDMIQEINRILFDDVIATLKAAYGETRDAWWNQGIPKAIKNEADKQYNNENGEKERWRYLYFIDYLGIVLHEGNWELFKDRYNFYGKGAKASLIRWIARVNKARTVTHHAEKGPLSRDEVAYVERVHELVKRHIEGNEPIEGRRQLLFDDRGAEAKAPEAEAA
ncbi:DGQHR domain-containing protein [Sphingomonas sp. BAUL-RG-20F-R05-02]|uniref:DGQHR domain-containing protein n=1 Tax=Sphingomonas sp. BAUL-RG-20F-R05-02 TaxID=2914830 RepID=UPI001F5981A8|nr:DGQHR domain-containing protein [Sphingomonas sp. BAUL-RG-20F-R05-02]